MYVGGLILLSKLFFENGSSRNSYHRQASGFTISFRDGYMTTGLASIGSGIPDLATESRTGHHYRGTVFNIPSLVCYL